MMNSLIVSVVSMLREAKILGEKDSICWTRQIIGDEEGNGNLFQSTTGQRFFVKAMIVNPEMSLDNILTMYKGEMKSLEAIAATKTIRVPKPYCTGVLNNKQGAFIVQEFVEFGDNKYDPKVQEMLGTQLAQLHLTEGSDMFGFDIHNTIGLTFQENTWTETWPDFLRRRLQYQFKLVKEKYNDPKLDTQGERLIANLGKFFKDVDIRPSLIHGDLWSGNYNVDSNGKPVIYDPAAYWGHHEAELGMIHFFGGFDRSFYDAYFRLIPKAKGFDQRLLIYTLYHALNHLNLFGRGYSGQCIDILNKLDI
ncbi:hypothetical protein H4219_000660 [Mycoemilia scoparia]|uniref:protein-ribulosamine 3-kinase n=1 Tax=Mycoemilia scoparia TaxID=417184 RepID=A0A9W8DSR1_9FUNG|nr:hypothetical protein H4219_000660 [Mycoemilia scoparia]